MNATTGIIYQTTGNPSRGQVSSYHCKPSPNKLNKTAFRVDVSGLKTVDRKTIHFDGQEFESKFTIGMEVEKNSLHRGAVREYELFCGFENDGSCAPSYSTVDTFAYASCAPKARTHARFAARTSCGLWLCVADSDGSPGASLGWDIGPPM